MILDIDKMRPAEEHQKILQLREQCGTKFYKKYNHKFVDISCPACGSADTHHEFVKHGFHHKKCRTCLTLFCSPRPKDPDLLEYYNTYDAPKYWTNFLLSIDAQRKCLQYRPRVIKILNFLKENRNNNLKVAVDLGAGSGAFALALQETDFFDKVIAYDFSEDCTKACISQGLDAKKGSVEDIPPLSVDFLSINDLIEHISDPLSFLDKCWKALSPNGFIQIATPNGEGFDFKILKENTDNIVPPEHLNYFNIKSIKTLLQRSGFSPLLIETPGILDAQIVIREMKGNNTLLTTKNEFIHYLLCETSPEVVDSFQRFLQKNLLSSHMLIIAQKNPSPPSSV